MNSLLNLLINCVFAWSASQMFSIKDECIFLFWNFLINGLSNSLANFWFNLFSLLTQPLGHALSKKL